MEPPFALAHCKIAILGLGLMGGSLAMALKGKTATLYGADPDTQAVELALKSKLLDHGSTDPGEVVPQADVVILAAPVSGILSLLADLPRLHPGGPVVMDLGSTKQRIADAMANLPLRFEPVGGHPMCGKEKSGLKNASPELFQNAPFALTLLPRTTSRARALAEQLIEAVGAYPVLVDAQVHDDWTAATSHMPYLLACALANATPQEAAPLVGPGLRSSTRLAGSSSQMMLDILSTNPVQVVGALTRFRKELDLLEELIKHEDWQTLSSTLERAARKQNSLAGARP
jgi:prephenate dehydrogenase